MKNSRISYRAHRIVGSAVALAIIALASMQARAQSAELSGIWRIEKPIFAVRTVDGKEPPLKPAAAKIYREHVEARKQGDTSFDSATWCASVGMPRIMFIDHPFEIMARPRYVAFSHEWNWWARIVYLDGALSAAASGSGERAPPPPPPNMPNSPPSGPPPLGSGALPGPMGLSNGKWEGDTLVVETTQLIDGTLIDGAGLPHSSELRLTERLRLRTPDVLENSIRIEDPATFTRLWETVVTYRRQRDTTLQEDVCLDRIKTGLPAVKE